MDIAEQAEATIQELERIRKTYGPLYVYTQLRNRANKKSGIAHGVIKQFFKHEPDKTFQVGVRINFNDQEDALTPSKAGGKMTFAVREKIGPKKPVGSNFDGWNRLWLVFKSDMYGDEHKGSWLKTRLGEFIVRGMREAKVPFKLPEGPLKDASANANDIQAIIASAKDSIVIMEPQNDIVEKRQRIPKRKRTAADPAAASKEPKQMKMIPQTTRASITTLHMLFGKDDAFKRLEEESSALKLHDLLSIGYDEAKEICRVGRQIIATSRRHE